MYVHTIHTHIYRYTIYLPDIYVHLPRQGKKEKKTNSKQFAMIWNTCNLNVLGIPKVPEKNKNKNGNWIIVFEYECLYNKFDYCVNKTYNKCTKNSLYYVI